MKREDCSNKTIEAMIEMICGPDGLYDALDALQAERDNALQAVGGLEAQVDTFTSEVANLEDALYEARKRIKELDRVLEAVRCEGTHSMKHDGCWMIATEDILIYPTAFSTRSECIRRFMDGWPECDKDYRRDWRRLRRRSGYRCVWVRFLYDPYISDGEK